MLIQTGCQHAFTRKMFIMVEFQRGRVCLQSVDICISPPDPFLFQTFRCAESQRYWPYFQPWSMDCERTD